jgi:hypothetical protein
MTMQERSRRPLAGSLAGGRRSRTSRDYHRSDGSRPLTRADDNVAIVAESGN